MLYDMLAKLAFCGLDGKRPPTAEHGLEQSPTGRVQIAFVVSFSVGQGTAVVAADAATDAAAAVVVAAAAAAAAAVAVLQPPAAPLALGSAVRSDGARRAHHMLWRRLCCLLRWGQLTCSAASA